MGFVEILETKLDIVMLVWLDGATVTELHIGTMGAGSRFTRGVMS